MENKPRPQSRSKSTPFSCLCFDVFFEKDIDFCPKWSFFAGPRVPDGATFLTIFRWSRVPKWTFLDGRILRRKHCFFGAVWTASHVVPPQNLENLIFFGFDAGGLFKTDIFGVLGGLFSSPLSLTFVSNPHQTKKRNVSSIGVPGLHFLQNFGDLGQFWTKYWKASGGGNKIAPEEAAQRFVTINTKPETAATKLSN